MTARLIRDVAHRWALVLACIAATTVHSAVLAQDPEPVVAAQPQEAQPQEAQPQEAQPQEAQPAPEAEPAPAVEAAAEPVQVWPLSWVTSLALVGEGEEIVAGTASGLLLREAAVVTTSADNLAAALTLYSHPTSVWAVAANADVICSADYRGNLMIMQRQSGEVKSYEAALERWTRALTLSPDNTHLVAGNEAGKVMAWSLEKNELIGSVELDPQQIYSIAFAPAGDRFAVTDGGGRIHLIAWPGLERQRTIELGTEPLWSAAFASAGDAIIAGGADRKLWKVPMTEGSQPEVLAETSDWITSIAAAPDGSGFAVGQLDGTVLVVDGTATAATAAATLPSGAWDLAMPADGTLIVATRQHALATLARSWTIAFAESPEASPSAEKETE